MAHATPGKSNASAVTLRAVAAHAGVSKSLVSRVLQGSPHVSDESRAAVEQAIKELGYRPNGAARSLTQRRSDTVGILVNDLSQPWLVDFMEGLHISLYERGLIPLLGDGRLDRATDEHLLRKFMEMRVDGLVLAATMPPSTTITEASRWTPTVISGGRDFDLPHVDTVAQDDFLGSRLALDHLYELGHRRIAHIGGDESRVFRIRATSYEQWMRERKLARHIRQINCDTTERGGYVAAQRLLATRAGAQPTAVLVANDYSCVGAMSAARELGLEVPGDVSFVGFDNSILARMHHIALTSVDVAAQEVGRVSAKYLFERMSAPELIAREHLVTPHLVIRTSTAPPRETT
jgi:DNA-binding LacI/PurR family transcriptional regulator